MSHQISIVFRIIRLSCDIRWNYIKGKFVSKVYLWSSLVKFVVTLQNQIDGCERKIKESLAQCAELVEDRNFEFCFSLGTFVNEITTINLDDELDNMKKVQELLKECEKIVATEKKRRNTQVNCVGSSPIVKGRKQWNGWPCKIHLRRKHCLTLFRHHRVVRKQLMIKIERITGTPMHFSAYFHQDTL